MAKLTREQQKIFASASNTNEKAAFGSMKSGTPIYSTDLSTLQTSDYEQGWQNGILVGKAPFLEEMNGVQYGLSKQIAYILQDGIAEWLSTMTYYKDCYCKVGHDIFYSNTDNNIGHNPTTDNVNWTHAGNYETATSTTSGIAKLYASTGSNTDGAMTQASITNALANKQAKLTAGGGIAINAQNVISVDNLNIPELIQKQDAISIYEIQNNTTIYNRLEKQKRSTFDRSKFTIVGSPTITDDGVASGFSNSNYLTIPTIDWTKDFDLVIKCHTPNSWSDSYETIVGGKGQEPVGVPSIRNYNGKWNVNLSGGLVISSSYTIELNTDYIIILNKTGNTYTLYANGVQVGATTGTSGLTENNDFAIGKYCSLYPRAFTGSIDLKQLTIIVDGVEVFNGNKTGIDQITSTLQIPYTQSKTGNKIVDSVYRDRVQDMYEQFGYTHYFTIDETNQNYTLQTVQNETIIDSGSNYEQMADLTLKQWGSCTSGTIVNLLPYKDTNYSVTAPYSAKTTSSFTPTTTGDYFAVGKIVLD